MIRALYSAASGMTAQQMNVDNIANNLANANTSGYKMRRAQFQDLLYQSLVQPGAAAAQTSVVPTGRRWGLAPRAPAHKPIFPQGVAAAPGNPRDVGVRGRGFFQVRRAPGEIAYTRSGSSHLDKDGSMVPSDGDQIEPQIPIPP